MSKLLNRIKFRELVLQRDYYKCVFCENTQVVAHHIFDRKLFEDGGYYLNNGATVCDEHHWQCEQTDISIEQVKLKCKIRTLMLPHEFKDNIV